MYYIATVDSYEVGSYEVDNYECPTIYGITLKLYINYDMALFVVNNGACPTHLSLMLEATYSIKPFLHEPHAPR